MSLVVSVFVPEAIVMASDSRQFLGWETQTADGQPLRIQTAASDFVYKTFLLGPQRTGISVFGDNILDGVGIESHIRQFQQAHLTDKDDVRAVADKLTAHFRRRFPGAQTGFHIAGFRSTDQASEPHAYLCAPGQQQAQRQNVQPGTTEVFYGARWDGEADVLARLINATQVRGADGKDQPIQTWPIPWQAMNVQDAIDFATHAVSATIAAMRFELRPKTVGGPVDVLVLTPSREFWAQRKKLLGEP